MKLPLETVKSNGARGGNIWIRVRGTFPTSGKLKRNGHAVGEWRAEGNQTVIHGTHPSGKPYTNNGKRPTEIDFKKIHWPAGLCLPWEPKPAAAPSSIPLEGCIILPPPKNYEHMRRQTALSNSWQSRKLCSHEAAECSSC